MVRKTAQGQDAAQVEIPIQPVAKPILCKPFEESTLMPRLNRYKPIGTTGEVNFKTTRPCVPTIRSHINQVVADTNSWEQAAVFRLEQAKGIVSFYARNDHLELSIPYEYFGIAHSYFPDFLVRLVNGLTLLLEIKGEEREMDRAKHQAARRWVSAVNHWGQLGTWAFHACRDPQKVIEEIKGIMKPDGQGLVELKVGAGDTAISKP